MKSTFLIFTRICILFSLFTQSAWAGSWVLDKYVIEQTYTNYYWEQIDSLPPYKSFLKNQHLMWGPDQQPVKTVVQSPTSPYYIVSGVDINASGQLQMQIPPTPRLSTRLIITPHYRWIGSEGETPTPNFYIRERGFIKLDEQASAFYSALNPYAGQFSTPIVANNGFEDGLPQKYNDGGYAKWREQSDGHWRVDRIDAENGAKEASGKTRTLELNVDITVPGNERGHMASAWLEYQAEVVSGIKVTSDIQDSYRRVDIVAGDIDQFHFRSKQPPQPGPYGVRNEHEPEGDIKATSSVNWDKIEFYAWGEQVGGGNTKGWRFDGNFHAQPFPAGQLPFTNPKYTWTYSGNGSGIDDLGEMPILQQDPTDPKKATMSIGFGSSPDLSQYRTGGEGWPKRGVVEVRVEDGDGKDPTVFRNYQYIKWHLPTDNWHIIPKPSSLVHTVDIGEPSEIIQFHLPVGGTVTSRPVGPSQEGEEIDIRAKADPFKFWLSMTDSEQEKVEFLIDVLLGVIGSPAGTRVPISKLDGKAVGQATREALSDPFIATAFSAALEDGLEFAFSGDSEDRTSIKNTMPNFRYAHRPSREDLQGRLLLEVPAGLINHSTIDNDVFDNNIVWKACQMEPVVLTYYYNTWRKGEQYDKHGYLGQLTSVERQPTGMNVVALYRWVGTSGSW